MELHHKYELSKYWFVCAMLMCKTEHTTVTSTALSRKGMGGVYWINCSFIQQWFAEHILGHISEQHIQLKLLTLCSVKAFPIDIVRDEVNKSVS